jgi:hypothetical protein
MPRKKYNQSDITIYTIGLGPYHADLMRTFAKLWKVEPSTVVAAILHATAGAFAVSPVASKGLSKSLNAIIKKVQFSETQRTRRAADPDDYMKRS